jgi:hypothetical protein
MHPMIGIFLFSLLLGAQDPVSIDLQFHTATYSEIDWARLSRMGIDQVTLRSYLDLPDQGGLYFQNGQFRVIQNRMTPPFVPIGKEEHKPQVIGWLIGRKYNWIATKHWFDSAYVNGKVESVEKIDLFNPEAVAAVVRTFADLARSGVDGVLIQDDMMLRHMEGFSSWGMAQYTQSTGMPPDAELMVRVGTPEYQNWNRVKINRVNSVVKEIVAACKQVNPACRVAMNVYYEAGVSAQQAEAWYAHNLLEILETGIDEIVLMAYHRQMAQEWRMDYRSPAFQKRFAQMLLNAIRIGGDRMRIKLQIRDWQSGERLAIEEILSLLQACECKISRIGLTPVKPGDLEWVEALLDKLRRKTR